MIFQALHCEVEMRPSSLCLNSRGGWPAAVRPDKAERQISSRGIFESISVPSPLFWRPIYDFGLLVLSPSRVNDYIDTGLADDLVDPDKGANVERKMQWPLKPRARAVEQQKLFHPSRLLIVQAGPDF